MANRNTLSTGLLLTFFFVASASSAQSINSSWKTDINSLLEKFMSCTASSTDTYTCSSFISESINKVYKVGGLYSDKSKRYLQLKEVSPKFDDASQWTLLGHAYDQKVLNDAQDLANANKATWR
jgi:hypothetical protein